MEVETKLEEKSNILTKLLSRQIRHWFQYINLKEISANVIIINNIDIFSLMIYKYDRLQWFWCDILATNMFEPNILSQQRPSLFWKNEINMNNQKIRLESIDNIQIIFKRMIRKH